MVVLRDWNTLPMQSLEYVDYNSDNHASDEYGGYSMQLHEYIEQGCIVQFI